MKVLAGFLMGMGILHLSILTIAATFMNLGTAAERISSRFDAMVILGLGAILWQLTQLLSRKKQ